MATLFIGRHLAKGRDTTPLAIKVIHEELSKDWQFVRMFVDEALLSVRIRHPNVVRVDQLGEESGLYYLVMEYVHGGSLAALLSAMGKKRRRMRPQLAVHIAVKIAEALHEAHQLSGDDGEALGVVHRDVSPQNVLLADDGRAKLLDFGIAKARGRAARTAAGVIKGKVRYMSPEQARGLKVDHRTDIYALAVVLWEMLTMRRYVRGKTDYELISKVRNPTPIAPSSKAPGISVALDKAILRALSLDPDHRPQTSLEFAQSLQACYADVTVSPQHIAELLRLFIGDSLAKSAQALPKEVRDPVEARLASPADVPEFEGRSISGEQEITRVETLTDGTEKAATEPAEVEGSDPMLQTKAGKSSARRHVSQVERQRASDAEGQVQDESSRVDDATVDADVGMLSEATGPASPIAVAGNGLTPARRAVSVGERSDASVGEMSDAKARTQDSVDLGRAAVSQLRSSAPANPEVLSSPAGGAMSEPRAELPKGATQPQARESDLQTRAKTSTSNELSMGRKILSAMLLIFAAFLFGGGAMVAFLFLRG